MQKGSFSRYKMVSHRMQKDFKVFVKTTKVLQKCSRHTKIYKDIPRDIAFDFKSLDVLKYYSGMKP